MCFILCYCTTVYSFTIKYVASANGNKDKNTSEMSGGAQQAHPWY
jgi:hypothetical protein